MLNVALSPSFELNVFFFFLLLSFRNHPNQRKFSIQMQGMLSSLKQSIWLYTWTGNQQSFFLAWTAMQTFELNSDVAISLVI